MLTSTDSLPAGNMSHALPEHINNEYLRTSGFVASDSIFVLLDFQPAVYTLHYLHLQGDVFCWIEVLSAVNTPKLKAFTTRVADFWLSIKLKVSQLHDRCSLC